MAPSLPDRLRGELLVARKARDDISTTALRTALAAIGNAEAPPLPDGPTPLDGHGDGDVPRLELTDVDHRRILHEEISRRHETADELAALDQHAAADRLRAEADVLASYLTHVHGTTDPRQ